MQFIQGRYESPRELEMKRVEGYQKVDGPVGWVCAQQYFVNSYDFLGIFSNSIDEITFNLQIKW